MSDIDTRLREILQIFDCHDIGEAAHEIKQAFAEEGYHIGKQVNVTTPNYMTGQEANKARLEEIDLMICNRHYGEGYADFFTEYANERRAALTTDKEQA